MSDIQVRFQLEAALFVGYENAEDYNGTGPQVPEKLLATLRVDEDAGTKDKARKSRLLCLTQKKTGKVKLHKVKSDGPRDFTISKSWPLDDIKSIDGVGQGSAFLLVLNKPYLVYAENADKKAAFLETLLDLCKRNLKKLPKLINLGEAGLAAAAKESAQSPTAGGGEPRARTNQEELEEEAEAEDVYSGLPVRQRKVSETPVVRVDLSEVLADFDWKVSGDASALELRLFNELLALEAANVHALIQSEEQADSVIQQLDKAIGELEVVDKWMTGYTDMLNRMGQDVTEIETKNKGLQVAAINQKLLLSELDSLLRSLQVPNWAVDTLTKATFNNEEDMEKAEHAASKLKIVLEVKFEDGLEKIHAVQDRLSTFHGYSTEFSNRLCAHLKTKLTQLGDSLQTSLKPVKLAAPNPALLPKLNSSEAFIKFLNGFASLIRWLKEMEPRKHTELQMDYTAVASKVYAKEVTIFVEACRSGLLGRKKEDELLFVFTVPAMSLTTAGTVFKTALVSNTATATSMFMRRNNDRPESGSSTGLNVGSDGKAAKKGLMGTSSTARGSSANLFGSDDAGNKLGGEEVFQIALEALVPVVIKEQNFCTDLFSLGSTVLRADESISSPSADGPTSAVKRVKDIRNVNRLRELMDAVFTGLGSEVHGLIDACTKHDATVAIAMLVIVEEHLRDFDFAQSPTGQYPGSPPTSPTASSSTSQSFLVAFLVSAQKLLVDIFDKFIDEQVKAISSSQFNLKKRSGILSFIRIFPAFVDRIESLVGRWDGPSKAVIFRGYEKIVKAMFESLEAIAKSEAKDLIEKEKTRDGKDGREKDDKEALNLYILTMENMHHFHSQIRARKVKVLEQYVKASKASYDLNLEAYVKVVIRRPLGKLLEFFEGVEEQMRKGSSEEVSFHLSYSRAALKDVLNKHPAKEIREGLKQLYKRVDKHFTEEEGLLQVVWRGIQEEFYRQLRKYEELIAQCYPHSNLRVECSVQELLLMFSEMAKSH